jgi:hypothetical protein
VSYLRPLDELNLAEFGDEAEDYQLNGSTTDMLLPAKRTAEQAEQLDAPGGETAGIAQTNEVARKCRKTRSLEKDKFGRGADVKLEDLPPRVREVLSKEEIGRADNVGVLFAEPSADALEAGSNKRSAVIRGMRESGCSSGASAGGQADARKETSGAETSDGRANVEVWVKCPLSVVSIRDGIHSCDPNGKPSLSIFRSLGYCAESDTSLVECRPYTGRTHQLRLHLELLGTPIANDPCYGGVLFYGDDERRQRAVAAVQEMRAGGIIPLSKVPHFGDPEVDKLLLTAKVAKETVMPTTCESPTGEAEEHVQAPHPGESEDDYLVRTCR